MSLVIIFNFKKIILVDFSLSKTVSPFHRDHLWDFNGYVVVVIF